MILVFGKQGQVAHSLSKTLPGAHFLSSQDAPFLDPQTVIAGLEKHEPRCVINAAAYTAVDKAESEREMAQQINATTPGLIAKWCARHQVPLIHYSTDYVFDGTGERPWLETDTPHPVNWYGATKLHGERLIQDSGCDFYLFRVSWVYSQVGHNFKKTIRRLAQEKKELRIVSDQWGSPTNASDIAEVTTALAHTIISAHNRPPPGLYHLRFSPYMTWFDFATQIVNELRQSGAPVLVENIIPITTAEFPTPARRPLNSRLDTLFPGLFL